MIPRRNTYHKHAFGLGNVGYKLNFEIWFSQKLVDALLSILFSHDLVNEVLVTFQKDKPMIQGWGVGAEYRTYKKERPCPLGLGGS